MKHTRWMVPMLLLAGLAGCGAQPGQTDVKYEKGKEPIMAEALRSGTYALYKATDTTPQVRFYVKRGEPLGFRGTGESLTAVAGEHQIPITETKIASSYYWKYQGDR